MLDYIKPKFPSVLIVVLCVVTRSVIPSLITLILVSASTSSLGDITCTVIGNSFEESDSSMASVIGSRVSM